MLSTTASEMLKCTCLKTSMQSCGSFIACQNETALYAQIEIMTWAGMKKFFSLCLWNGTFTASWLKIAGSIDLPLQITAAISEQPWLLCQLHMWHVLIDNRKVFGTQSPFGCFKPAVWETSVFQVLVLIWKKLFNNDNLKYHKTWRYFWCNGLWCFQNCCLKCLCSCPFCIPAWCRGRWDRDAVPGPPPSSSIFT